TLQSTLFPYTTLFRSVNIDDHDYLTKIRHGEEFLDRGNKVRVQLQFRGREMAHQEFGMQLWRRSVTIFPAWHKWKWSRKSRAERSEEHTSELQSPYDL